MNNEIRTTLQSDRKRRFVLMNNGVTIIARNMTHTGSKFVIEDFQIVNGCQTSHVLFDHASNLDESVLVPLRLIWTQEEDVIEDIIHATNKQTEVTFAITDFARQLEAFFKTFPDGRKLYYERRSRQYDGLSIEKTRVVLQTNAVRSFAGMFLGETSRPISLTNRANANRESRSIAHSGRACGDPNLSSKVRPCFRSASRACSDRSNASHAFVRRRTW